MDEDGQSLSFVEMGLDPCLLQAISDLNWSEPTEIQASIIPLVLDGKNVMGRARTGCGKTGGFAIPVIHKILQAKQHNNFQQTSAIILAPSRELCSQAERNIMELTSHCSRDVQCLDITSHKNPEIYKPLLAEKPDIVIGTPARLLAHLKAGHLVVKETLRILVVDEADLIFGFGYEADAKELRNFLPPVYQAVLMSATLMDVKKLRKCLLGVAQWMSVELPDEPLLPTGTQLTQYTIHCSEEDKFVLACVLFKLRLIRGKTLVFLNSTDRCYRLKLFLEQFGIRTVILNSELPVASRLHTVSQFNSGVYNILLASDDSALTGERIVDKKRKKGAKADAAAPDSEYGVSRGVDFHHVSNVVNFDFPVNPKAYVHRVGRTARADQKGTALSLLSEKEKPLVEAVEKLLSRDGAEIFKPFNFKMEEVEAFRYRARDAMRKVTTVAVREARKMEIKSELLNSTKLKGYFEDHAVDLKTLRHERQLLSGKKADLSLGNVPDYAIPKTLRLMLGMEVYSRKRRHRGGDGGSKGGRGGKRKRGGGGKIQKRAADPLYRFEAALQKKKRKK